MRTILIILIASLSAIKTSAQHLDNLWCFNSVSGNCVRYEASDVATPHKSQAHSQHLYLKMDLGSANIFSLCAMSLASAGLNAATNRSFSVTSFLVSPITAKAGSTELDIENYKWNLLDGNDLFKDVQLGGRIGWKSAEPLNVANFGFYGSFHYRINQFKIEDKAQNDYLKHNIQRMFIGLTAFVDLGDWEHGLVTTIEAGVRYSIATKYKNPYNLDKGALNNGLTTHFAVYLSPTSDFALQDLGFFVDINHFNLLNDSKMSFVGLSEIRTWTMGISFAINSHQADVRAKY